MSVSVRFALEIATTLLVLDGVFALTASALLSLAQGAVAILAVLGSLAGDWLGARGQRLPVLRGGFALGAALFAVLDLFYLAESLLHGLVHLLLLVACYRLYTRQALRDFRDLFFLSFFMLVAASTLTVSVAFLLILVVFLILGIWTFVLYHLLTETERYTPGQIASLSGRKLGGASLLTVSLVASALTLAFTLVFFFIIPRVGLAAITLGPKVGPKVSGFSDRVELGAFGAIQTDPTVVMRVRFPDGPPSPEVWEGLRWRGMVFDEFTGREWRVSRSERKPIPRNYDGRFVLAAPRGGRILTQDIYLEPFGADIVFAAPRLLSLVLPVRVAMVDHTNSVSILFPNARLRYLAYSEVGGVPRREGVRALTGESEAQYLQLPPLSPRVAALAGQVTARSRDPYEAALALTDYLRRSFRYTLDLRRETTLPPLEEFLFVTRAGNCEYFAASLAVLLRHLGIPARVVAGFQRGEWNSYGEYLVVRQHDAHSWVEAHFPGRGWVTLDPTPRDEVDAAFQTGQLSQFLDALRMGWYRYIVNWSLTDQITVASAVRHQVVDWRRAVARAQIPAAWGAWGGWLLGGGVVGAVVLLAVWRRANGAGGRYDFPGARRPFRPYDEVLKRLARRALIPRPSETAREFAARAGWSLPRSGVALREITDAYERVRYGEREMEPREEGRLLALAKSLGARGEPVKPGGVLGFLRR